MVAGDISMLTPIRPHPWQNQVRFEDIGGLEDAKRAINEAVILPLLMPEFFVGLRHLATPWFSSFFFRGLGTPTVTCHGPILSPNITLQYYNT